MALPSPHQGGALLLRHLGQEWTFDSGEALAATKDQPSIGYVAFFSDIEHEVAPVTSGHRITLTYNLYFDDGGSVSPNDAVSERFVSTRLPIQVHFRDAFAALLGDQNSWQTAAHLRPGCGTSIRSRRTSTTTTSSKGATRWCIRATLRSGMSPGCMCTTRKEALWSKSGWLPELDRCVFKQAHLQDAREFHLPCTKPLQYWALSASILRMITFRRRISGKM